MRPLGPDEGRGPADRIEPRLAAPKPARSEADLAQAAAGPRDPPARSEAERALEWLATRAAAPIPPAPPPKPERPAPRPQGRAEGVAADPSAAQSRGQPGARHAARSAAPARGDAASDPAPPRGHARLPRGAWSWPAGSGAGLRAARPGPGPSKIAYRLTRAWAKPGVRALALVHLPLVLAGFLGWRVVADDGLRRMAQAEAAALLDHLAQRPEFAVTRLEISGGSDRLRAIVEREVGLGQGASSLTFDVAALRARIEAIGAVAYASVQLDPQGVLKIEIAERAAAALWRSPEGRLALIDATGVDLGPVARRADHPTLPLVLGEGAPERVGEALALIAAVPDIVPRLRAIVRIGQRRWDLVLARDLVIQLPEEGALMALQRIMGFHYGEELLERDLAVIDLRLPDRPTLRMGAEAAEIHRLRQLGEGGRDT